MKKKKISNRVGKRLVKHVFDKKVHTLTHREYISIIRKF